MDFEDQLPCGGYEKEDKQIKQAMESISLGENHKPSKQGCDQQNCCKNECTQNCNYKKQQIKQQMKKMKSPMCKKCKQNPSVLMHKNEPICKECLHKNIEYKCRLNLQNKIKIKGTDSVLLCFSGALNSIALINIMKNLKIRYKKHPLFGQLKSIYIQQQERLPDNYVENFEKFTEMKLEVIPIYQVFQKPQMKSFKSVKKLLQSFKQSANSSDLVQIFRNRLIKSYAKKNNFNHILKGNNCENLATEVFKNFTKGKGGNITDISTYDGQSFGYPLRQHLQKELQYYFYAQRLSVLSLKAEQDDLSYIVGKALDNHLIGFISNLQNMYSHTCPAIVRTSEKLESNRINEKYCKWCQERGINQDIGLCLRCQRMTQAKKVGDDQNNFPQWMKL